MAARGSKNAQQRTEAERARLHAARTEWHDGLIRRRVRDNTIAGIVGALIVAAAIGSQVWHAQVAPPAPAPTVEPTDAPLQDEAPLPEQTPLPDPAPSEDAPAG
jgi:hypothetical protein